MGSATIQSTAVNSGTAVTLSCVNLRYVWKGLVNHNPSPGSFQTKEADVAGFENPLIRMSGVIDLGEDTTTLEHIKSFARLQFDGTTATAIKLTITAGTYTLKDYQDSNSFIYVVIKNFDFSIQGDIQNERKLIYNIDFVETALSS
jgi:hypothetical protein